jgi:hypothetical protein
LTAAQYSTNFQSGLETNLTGDTSIVETNTQLDLSKTPNFRRGIEFNEVGYQLGEVSNMIPISFLYLSTYFETAESVKFTVSVTVKVPDPSNAGNFLEILVGSYPLTIYFGT